MEDGTEFKTHAHIYLHGRLQTKGHLSSLLYHILRSLSHFKVILSGEITLTFRKCSKRLFFFSVILLLSVCEKRKKTRKENNGKIGE